MGRCAVQILTHGTVVVDTGFGSNRLLIRVGSKIVVLFFPEHGFLEIVLFLVATILLGGVLLVLLALLILFALLFLLVLLALLFVIVTVVLALLGVVLLLFALFLLGFFVLGQNVVAKLVVHVHHFFGTTGSASVPDASTLYAVLGFGLFCWIGTNRGSVV